MFLGLLSLSAIERRRRWELLPPASRVSSSAERSEAPPERLEIPPLSASVTFLRADGGLPPGTVVSSSDGGLPPHHLRRRPDSPQIKGILQPTLTMPFIIFLYIWSSHFTSSYGFPLTCFPSWPPWSSHPSPWLAYSCARFFSSQWWSYLYSCFPCDSSWWPFFRCFSFRVAACMATSSSLSAGLLPGRSADPLSIIRLFLHPSPFIRAGEYPSRSLSSLTPRVLPVPLVSRESSSLNRIVRRFILDYRCGRIKLCLGNPPFSDQNVALLKATKQD